MSLKMKRVGFIGAGNMAEAMVRGLFSSGSFKKRDITLSDVDPERLSYMSSRYGVFTTPDNSETVMNSDVAIFSVKPQVLSHVCREVRNVATTDKLYVSIAAGVRHSFIKKLIGREIKLARVMPNTPSLVLEGASCVYFAESFSEEEEKFVIKIFGSLGKAFRLENEELMDVVTAISGSGPAFVSMFIEALSDGAVKMGLSRKLAIELAAQTVLGTSKMIQEGVGHPAEIKDMVTSPGGTTASGIHSLERASFRAAVISAVESATNRSLELSEEEE
ncbi:MAG: pyrroline-5-carboxylate reductase [Candidatus Dadabacteria bacterium]|nr:pyrroline-5-carboxylate reductase [Candidatus Dadabacteria bacterium]MCY4262363.1 pyrroline-5-carboxylate reductase [Candidatus Dadabacteria bacterium]